MNLQTFLAIMLRNWWIIILAVVLTAGSTALFVSFQPRIYRASTTVELKPSATLESTNEILNSYTALTRPNTLNTLARKATSDVMHNQVAQALGVSAATIRNSGLTAVTVPNTNLIEIRADSTNPEFAAAIANAVSQQLLGQVESKVMELQVIDPATPPTAPIEPQPTRLITLGVVFGLVLGMLFAMAEYGLRQAREGGWLTSLTNGAQLSGANKSDR